jgi:hypothetical protein
MAYLYEQRNRLQQKIDSQANELRRQQFALKQRNNRITYLETLVKQHEVLISNYIDPGYGIVVDQRERAYQEIHRLGLKLARRSRNVVRLLSQREELP